jgi:hypothetical protein
MFKHLTIIALVAGCNAPDAFVLSAVTSPDAAPNDARGDADVRDGADDAAPADAAQPDVVLADDASNDADVTETAVADADVQVADATDDASDASAGDVALDAGDAAVDASDAVDAPADVDVFAVCERISTIAECTAVRYADGTGCGWCVGIDRCVFGRRIGPRSDSCGKAWVW